MALATHTPALIDAAAGFLFTVALKGALILLLAGLINLTLIRAAAALRHLVWTLALIAVVLLPAITPLTPRWAVPGLPALEPASRSEPRIELPAPRPAAPAPAIAGSMSPQPETETPAAAPRAAATEGGVPGATRGAVESLRSLAAFAIGSTWARAVETPRGEEARSAPAPGVEPGEGTSRRSDVPVASLALLAWVMGALAVAVWIIIGLVRVRGFGRGGRRVADASLRRMLERLSSELGLRRPVRLLLAEGDAPPMTWGVRRPTILLPAAAVAWSTARLRAVLLHELAHIKRHDCLIQLVARAACALHWFNPLVWLAAARLRVERELACDDEVLRAGSLPSDYAGHLLEVARSLRPAMASGAAVPMARGPQIGARLRAVLDAGRRRGAVSGRMVVAGSLGAASLALTLAGAGPALGGEEVALREARGVPQELEASQLGLAAEVSSEEARLALESEVPSGKALPALVAEAPWAAPRSNKGEIAAPTAQRCDWFGTDGSSSTSININDHDMRAKLRRGDCELQIELSGVVTFNEAETDVASLTPGGQLEIEEKAGRSRRRLVIESDRDGGLDRSWYIDGDERPYDAEARAWLGEMILVLHRRAGYQATERAKRILAAKGVDGVLEEISQIPSDHTAGRYYAVVLSEGKLQPDDMRRIVRQAGERIDSDYELATLLVSVAQNHPLDESVRAAYVEAAGSLDSDYEHRRALSAILQREDLSPELAREMLEQAAKIDSDFELASLLIEIMERRPLQPAMLDPFFSAVGKIESDFERRRVLNAAIEGAEAGDDRELLDRSLQAAQAISSDFELASLLITVAAAYPGGEPLPASYLTAAASIESDHELARVVTTLLQRDGLNPASVAEVLGLAKGIDSDFECSRVLQAVLDAGPLEPPSVEALLDAALGIDSDFEMARLLVSVASAYPIDEALRPAFMRAADTIDSEYERGRVLSAATPRTQQGR